MHNTLLYNRVIYLKPGMKSSHMIGIIILCNLATRVRAKVNTNAAVERYRVYSQIQMILEDSGISLPGRVWQSGDNHVQCPHSSREMNP